MVIQSRYHVFETLDDSTNVNIYASIIHNGLSKNIDERIRINAMLRLRSVAYHNVLMLATATEVVLGRVQYHAIGARCMRHQVWEKRSCQNLSSLRSVMKSSPKKSSIKRFIQI